MIKKEERKKKSFVSLIGICWYMFAYPVECVVSSTEAILLTVVKHFHNTPHNILSSNLTPKVMLL